jgi:NADH-ubiquinone oxidoreductase chain 5
MYLLILYLPFLSFLNGTLFGRWMGRKGSPIWSCILMGLSLLLALFIVYEVSFCNSSVYIYINNWLNIDYLNIKWVFVFDTLTSLMLLVVTSISFLVHVYSISYMNGDPHLQRFISLLSLFTFFMIILVTGWSLLQIFVGWEGVGVVSYLLVNFWYTRAAANRAAMMALLTNRVGDWGYTLGAFIALSVLLTLDCSTIFGVSPLLLSHITTVITLALVIGVMGKSAQLGLHAWLPHAMEGPTPVSALLHAATLVTAGVFLLLRMSPMLEYAPITLTVLTVLGGATAFLGGSLGLVANDMKRVIAYSTCSQLGYMVYAIGISAYSVSLYHLVNHAFFKALLFLSAGSVIHALGDEQDLRKMGGLRKVTVFTYVMMLIGSISLMGVPFTTGFYSKEVILGLGYYSTSMAAGIGYILCLISALFTTIYSVRLLCNGFLVPSWSSKAHLSKSHEPEALMTVPLAILAVLSLVFGYMSNDLFSTYSSFLSRSLFTLPHNLKMEYWGGGTAALSLTIIGGLIALIINLGNVYYFLNTTLTTWVRSFYNLLSLRYYFDNLFSIGVTLNILALGYITSKELDKGLGEYLGPTGISNGLHSPASKNGEGVPGLLNNESPILYGGYLILALFIAIALLLHLSN